MSPRNPGEKPARYLIHYDATGRRVDTLGVPFRGRWTAQWYPTGTHEPAGREARRQSRSATSSASAVAVGPLEIGIEGGTRVRGVISLERRDPLAIGVNGGGVIVRRDSGGRCFRWRRWLPARATATRARNRPQDRRNLGTSIYFRRALSRSA
jgi:hypothetical protein